VVTVPRRTSLPPVDGRAVTNQAGRELGVGKVAELPQFLRRLRVLKEDPVEVYAHALNDQEGLSRRRIAAALESSWPEISHG
jgi:hypothetical protein